MCRNDNCRQQACMLVCMSHQCDQRHSYKSVCAHLEPTPTMELVSIVDSTTKFTSLQVLQQPKAVH